MLSICKTKLSKSATARSKPSKTNWPPWAPCAQGPSPGSIVNPLDAKAPTQISYTLRMRSHTDYVRPNEVAQLRHELAAYRRFKQLTARWVQVALRRSRWLIRRARSVQGESTSGSKRGRANVAGPERKNPAKTR